MQGSFLVLFGIALAAGLASPLGGALAIWLRPSSLLLSLAVGFAGGVLLGTFAFEMIPKALELSSVPVAVLGFCLGFGPVYLLDLFVNRWSTAGTEAEQREAVDRVHRRRRPLGSQVMVLAGGTSAEELIEGISIGVGSALDPSVAIIVGLAICVDNLSEAMSIGELTFKEGGERPARRIVGWTSVIGVALFASAMAGSLLFRGMPDGVLGVLLAGGAGGMFYLTVTDLVPEAEAHQYQQSSAIAIGVGFIGVMVLSELM
jgi:ZIP family zinc transporter